MKKILFTMALLGFSILPLSGEQYITVSGGSDYCHKTDDNDHGQKVGYKIGGAYGYRFSNGVRGELEICYRDGHKRTKYIYSETQPDQKTHSSFHSMSYMANVLFDASQLTTYSITPFIGVGVGVCSNTFQTKTQKGDVTDRDKGKDDRFAYQAILGAKYPIDVNLDLTVSYNFHVGMYHGKNHSFGLGIVRGF